MNRHQASSSQTSAAVTSAVTRAALEGRVLNVGAEAQRISEEAGVSARTVAGELVEVGIRARANIEFPRLAELEALEASTADKPISARQIACRACAGLGHFGEITCEVCGGSGKSIDELEALRRAVMRVME